MATKTEKTPKLLQVLTANSNDSLAKRGTLTFKNIENELSISITEKKREINKLEMEIEELTDLSITNTTDLKPNTNLDPSKWVKRMYEIKLELLNLNAELKILTDLGEEWL